jgi:hypothetical protein
MRLRLAYIGIFILLFLLAVVLQWPATSLAPWIDRASNGQWRLAAVEGRPWNGNGILLVRAGDASQWRIAQSVRWQLRWSELLTGRLAADLTMEQGGLRLVASGRGFSVEQIEVALPAAEVAPQLPGALGRYGWSGTLHAHSTGYRCNWSAQNCNGEIDLLWNDASVTEIPGPALGDYRLHLVGEGPTLRVDLATLRGRLQLNGSGEISSKSVRFNGEASATGADAEALDALLNTLGRPAGVPNKYLIEYRQ